MSNYRRKINPWLFKLNWLSTIGIIAAREETKKQVAKATHSLCEQGMHSMGQDLAPVDEPADWPASMDTSCGISLT